MSVDISVKQGEAKTIKFTVTSGGGAVDLTTTVLQFAVKDKKDDKSYIWNKVDADFDKTVAITGVVSVNVSATDTNKQPTQYLGELKITFTATNIDKSADITVNILKAVII